MEQMLEGLTGLLLVSGNTGYCINMERTDG